METRVLALNADPVFQDRALAILDEIEGLELQVVRNLSEAVQALLDENFDGLIIEYAQSATGDPARPWTAIAGAAGLGLLVAGLVSLLDLGLSRFNPASAR